MSRNSLWFFVIAGALLVTVAACSKVPGAVIKPEKMAQLMADVHTAEAYMEMNRGSFSTDSARQAMKQAVYERHGVSQAQVDTSFGWYGRNISYYMEVYDRTIEILDQRLIESGNRVALSTALSIAGDSVDVWGGPRLFRINDRMPSKILTFAFGADENRESGDLYIWRAKFFDLGTHTRWGMAAEYDDGAVEYISHVITSDGWQELAFQTDSTRKVDRLHGYLTAENPPRAEMVLDSVQMVRKRLNHNQYGAHSFTKRIQFNHVEQ